MASLFHEEVEMFANNLMKAGILSQADYNTMWSNERIGMREDRESPLTIDDVIAAVPQGGLKNSQMDLFDSIAGEVGATVERGEHEALRAIMGRDRRGFFGDFKAGLGVIGGGIGDALGALGAGGTGAHEIDVPGGTQTIRDIVRALKEQGYEAPSSTFFRNAESMDEVIEIIMDKTDISSDELAGVLDIVEEQRIDRDMSQADIEDALAANEEMDDTNLANPEYSKNLRAFEILNNATPTKYQFDESSGAIFMTDGTGQVDRTGQVIPFGSEGGAELVGGWEGGIEPDFSSVGLAEGLETAWAQMTRETGSVVDEQMYMSVLDVVANKEHYGADPVRYLPGQEAFLGGYKSTYQVNPESFQPGSRYDYGRDATEQFTMLSGEMKPIALRPTYDKDDEWAQFVGMSSENIAAVQSFMVGVGALEEDGLVHGVWGPTEAQQMYKILDIANAGGVSWQDVDEEILRNSFDKETAATTQRAAFVPQAYRPMDPARAELTVKDSIRQMLGRDPTEEDMSQLGGYLTDMHSASYEADTQAARNRYNTQVALDKSGGTFGTPAAVEEVDFEARYIQKMEERFAPQLESQKRGQVAEAQQDMGVKMNNLMSFVGGA